MTRLRVTALTTLAMLAFAGNSLLCRQALKHTEIDAASFTSIRLMSGALMLWVLVRVWGKSSSGFGSWPSALALFAYAAGFSLAYVDLTAGTGALLDALAVGGGGDCFGFGGRGRGGLGAGGGARSG